MVESFNVDKAWQLFIAGNSLKFIAKTYQISYEKVIAALKQNPDYDTIIYKHRRPWAKLSEQDIKDICYRFEHTNIILATLAREYNLNANTIKEVIQRELGNQRYKELARTKIGLYRADISVDELFDRYIFSKGAQGPNSVSIKALAMHYNTTRNVIWQLLSLHPRWKDADIVALRNRKIEFRFSQAQINDMFTDYKTGMTIDQIASKYQINKITARKFLRKFPEYEDIAKLRKYKLDKKRSVTVTTKIYRPGTVDNQHRKGPNSKNRSRGFKG